MASFFSSGASKPMPGVPYEVQQIYEMLTPKPKELITNAYSRRFIRQGEVGVYNQNERVTKRRYLFLFNDVLLITKQEAKKSFWLKVFISLRSNLNVEDVPDSTTKHKVEFRIYAPKRTFILFTRTVEEKHMWLREIRSAVSVLAGGETRDAFGYSVQNPTPTFSAPEASSTPLPTQIQPAQPTFQISGDIGTIEIPGFEFSESKSTEKKKSTVFDLPDFDEPEDFIPPSSTNKPAPIPFQAPPPEIAQPPVNKTLTELISGFTPATPPSTPVEPSGFDDFDMLANREKNQKPVANTPAVDFFAQPQTPAFPTPQGFNAFPSQPVTLQPAPFVNTQPGFPSASPVFGNNFGAPSAFANAQPLAPQPLIPSQPLAPQPFSSSQPLGGAFASSQPLAPQTTGLQPFSSSILQPTPANTTPSAVDVPNPSAGFAALKALNVGGQPNPQPTPANPFLAFGNPQPNAFGQPTNTNQFW